MTEETTHGLADERRVRIAAAGDMHCRPGMEQEIGDAFAQVTERADAILLAGDLTTHGQPEQGAVLADACRDLDVPVVAVLGNHDWHCDQAGELCAVLREAGIVVLEREHTILPIAGLEVGIAGLKGFVGGFTRSHLPDFGEPLLRRVYDETSADVDALDHELRAIAHCQVRVALMHYAPSEATLVGEPETIWTMLGNDRLQAPIRQHEPDLVLHGHAHAGTFEGRIGDVPVYNVSVPVMQQDFWVFELQGVSRAAAPLH